MPCRLFLFAGLTFSSAPSGLHRRSESPSSDGCESSRLTSETDSPVTLWRMLDVDADHSRLGTTVTSVCLRRRVFENSRGDRQEKGNTREVSLLTLDNNIIGERESERIEMTHL